MRTTLASVIAAAFSMTALFCTGNDLMTGAGATFPAPVASSTDSYQKETGNKINYQALAAPLVVTKQIIAG